ncbi:MAG: winged helix-turn-helix transcriptional regulator [Clostridia bacterium]|nr:winged helix-turn-helix transcriptional regulator [Clostridia bacterium]
MRWEVLKENCIFAFLPEAEPLFGAYSLLDGETAHQLCTDLYGAEQIAAWRRRYRFLFETFDAVKALAPYSLFDIFLDVLDEGFTMEGFKAHILSLPEDERVFRQAGWGYFCGAEQEDILRALTDDAALYALYARVEAQCPGFLGFSSFVRQNRRYIEEYFELAAEMDMPMLGEALRARQKEIDAFRARVEEELKESDGLECAQKLMGKNFRNRGPYEQFCFLPSLLLPFASIRFFRDNGTPHNRQIMFCSIREPEKGREDTLSALKALSDETRYQILMLLAKHGSVNGQDIARTLKLAPSTVSHHMTELKACGLVSEEPVKTAKYYGLSQTKLRELLAAVADDLKLSEDADK